MTNFLSTRGKLVRFSQAETQNLLKLKIHQNKLPKRRKVNASQFKLSRSKFPPYFIL